MPVFPNAFIQCFQVTFNDSLMGHTQHCVENASLVNSLATWPCSCPISSFLLSCVHVSLLHMLLQNQAPSFLPGHYFQGFQSTESGQAPHWGDDVGDCPHGGPHMAMLPAEPPTPTTTHWRRQLLCFMQSLTWTALGTDTQPKLFGRGGPA